MVSETLEARLQELLKANPDGVKAEFGVDFAGDWKARAGNIIKINTWIKQLPMDVYDRLAISCLRVQGKPAALLQQIVKPYNIELH